jgi:hypothetical protein
MSRRRWRSSVGQPGDRSLGNLLALPPDQRARAERRSAASPSAKCERPTALVQYRASGILHRAFPGVRIIGLFIARRVPEAVDIEDFDF